MVVSTFLLACSTGVTPETTLPEMLQLACDGYASAEDMPPDLYCSCTFGDHNKTGFESHDCGRVLGVAGLPFDKAREKWLQDMARDKAAEP